MTKNTLLKIGLILFLASCQEKIAKFIYDSAKTNIMTRHEYEVKNGNIESQVEKTYTLMFRTVVDSMLSKTLYEYDNKGRVIKESSIIDANSKPRFTLYSYDTNDSLLLRLTINSEGDTDIIQKYRCFPDLNKVVYFRFLAYKFVLSEDMMRGGKYKKCDTLISTHEYEYENGLCKSSKEVKNNKKSPIIEEYEYKEKKLYKIIQYTLFGNKKLKQQTRYYNYSKNKNAPEFYSLGVLNDTVEYKKYQYRDNAIVCSIEYYDGGNDISQKYYDRGRLIGYITINKKMNMKDVCSMNYYSDGKIKEERHYNEKINAR